MPTYIAGPTGAGIQDGSNWANRLAGLNAVEDLPVIAGDTAIFGPGVYRERLTCDVSGAAGSPIIYIADVTGENTDSVGGVVRIAGSDNDQTTTRDHCIRGNAIDYRTFRGFSLDMGTDRLVFGQNGCDNWILEDCTFLGSATSTNVECDAGDNWIIRRCVFLLVRFTHIFFDTGGDDSDHLVENCLFVATGSDTITIDSDGDMAVRSCTFIGAGGRHITCTGVNAGQLVTVENCILCGSENGALASDVLGRLVEDYNTFSANATDRTNVDVGTHSVTYPPLLLSPLLNSGANQSSGYKMPWWFGELSEWSQVRAIQGSNPPLEDLLGIERPHPDSRKSWGAVQFHDVERSTAQAHGGTASELHSRPGRKQFFVPSTNVSTTVSAWVYREANYRADRNPGFVLKQPGAADRMTRDAGAVAQWNQISDTFTPNALPPWFMIELVNDNYYSTTTSTSSTSTSTTRTDTSTSTSTTTTSTSTTTTTLNVYFDDIIVN